MLLCNLELEWYHKLYNLYYFFGGLLAEYSKV